MAAKELIESIDKYQDLKKENSKDSSDLGWMDVGVERKSFHLYCKTRVGLIAYPSMYSDPGEFLLSLDQEDLDYLYNKYKPLVEVEIAEARKKELEDKEKEREALIKKIEKLQAEMTELRKKL